MSWFSDLPYLIYTPIVLVISLGCFYTMYLIHKSMWNQVKGKISFFCSLILGLSGFGVLLLRTSDEFQIWQSAQKYLLITTFVPFTIAMTILLSTGLIVMIQNRADPVIRFRLKCLGVLMLILLLVIIFLAIIWDK